MARSTYIYIVRFGGPWAAMDETPLAMFTVKHEAKSWIARQPDRAHMIIIRTRDGLEYDPIAVDG